MKSRGKRNAPSCGFRRPAASVTVREVRFAADSALEERGFEPSVPREKDWPYETIVIDLAALLVREKKSLLTTIRAIVWRPA